MKVFVFVDMEGVNADVEGVLEGGAKKVVVNDSHGTMRNIIPEELHEETELVTSSPKPMLMIEGIARSAMITLAGTTA